MINFNPINNSYNPYRVIKKDSIIKNNRTNQAPLNLSYYPIPKSDYIKLGVYKTPNNDEIHAYRLSSGQKIGLIKKSGCPSIECRVGVGSLCEDKGQKGLSHLIEHSIYHSSKKYPQIESEVKNLGGYTNAATTTYDTNFYITLDNNKKENIEKAVDILSDMIYNPNFDKLDKEKAIVKAEIEKYNQDENQLTTNLLIKQLINSDYESDLVAGDEKTIDSIKKEDLFNYHKKYYNPNNITCSITSEFEPDELIKSVSKSFLEASKNRGQTIAQKPIFPISRGVKRKDVVSKNDTQGYLRLGFLIPGAKNAKEQVRINALVQLISTLTNFYGLNSSLNDNYNILSLEANLSKTNEYELLFNLKEQLEKFKLDSIDDYQIEYIKNNLIQELESEYKNNLTITSKTTTNLLNDNYNNEKELIENLDKKDIIEAIKYLDFDNFSMVVEHPKGTNLAQIEEKYQNSKGYVKPIILSKEIRPIDLTNQLVAHNLYPYTKEPVWSAKLPDNTTLIAINSKNSECAITKELYNPNLSSYNISAKYVLEKMKNPLNIEQSYNQIMNNSTIYSMLDLHSGFAFISSTKKDNIDKTLKILKNSFDVDFTKEKFDKAKREVLFEIENQKENSKNIYQKEAFGNKYNKNSQDIKKALETLTLDELKSYYNEVIKNSSSLVVVSAPFCDNPELLNKIASGINTVGFSYRKDIAFENYQPKNTKNVYCKEQIEPQGDFSKIYNFRINNNPKDIIRFTLLSNVLGNRLYNDLREKQGLAYDVGTECIFDGCLGAIELKLSSSCNDVNKIFLGFDKNIQELLTKPITKTELEQAKSAFRREVMNSCNSDLDFLISILDNLKTAPGLMGMKNNFDLLEEINPYDIQKTAQYVFSNKPISLVNANKKTIEEVSNTNLFL